MSKAFTSEENEDDELEQGALLPPGTRNYMTKTGAEKLRQELEHLQMERRGLRNDLEGTTRLKVIDRRLRHLIPRMEALEIIDPAAQPKDRVLFGASVTVSDRSGKSETWRIVGMDEMDLDLGWISWMSPLASALLEKRVGDMFAFMGRELTVTHIGYDA